MQTQLKQQALVFFLGGEEFGVDILQVQEIRDRIQHTSIPSQPAYFKGVTNLRGEFLPVIDLRVKLGTLVAGDASEGVTIILNAGSQRIGVVVDAVSEVIEFSAADVKPMPAIEFAPAAGFVRGLVNQGEVTIVLLDMAHLVEMDERGLQALSSRAELAARAA